MSDGILNINYNQMFLPLKTKLIGGQSLIGILIAMAVFSIISQAIFTVVGVSFNLVSYNRARITARHLAQEKLELIRNLPYDSVGTVGGIPSGPLAQEEQITRNKLNYTVRTTIIYVDDIFDDVVPNDLLSSDYKRVRVEVSWQGIAGSRNSPVVFLTDIVPKGIETTEGGGTLSILVFDSNGNPLYQADVTIVAATDPAVNMQLQTGSNGRVLLPGAPACISCYQISVTKAGYSSDRTYSTSEVANPNKPHQTIREGQLTEISFAIDRLSTLNVVTKKGREDGFEALGNVNFIMRGDKTIGTDTDSQPVYKYNENLLTDGGGNLTLGNLEWDSYNLDLPTGSPYDFSGNNPSAPISILAGSNSGLSLALSANSASSLLINFVDASLTSIASVSATLTDGGGFSSAKFSGLTTDPDFGQVFFSNLVNQSYNITATASGYVDYTGSIDVSGDMNERVILNP